MIADVFRLNAIRMLDTLEAAIRCDIPTAMLGQGFGPIRDEKLLHRAAQVLPQVHVIFIRERPASLPLLQKLGVPDENIFVTGDDAIEPAFHEKPAAPGNYLGVNLRLADYAALDAGILEPVRAVLAEKARQLGTTLAGIPILIGDGSSDVNTLHQLLGNADAGGDLDTPLKVIRRISNCRVVVTGSYHAAVFALAQGIPVAGIVQSDYYRDKFCGLADQFGDGCIVLPADDAEFSKKLGAAIDELWTRAGELKPKLLAAAECQIAAAQAAYAWLPGLLRR
jgi:colanic acid/amylovoran biosynthesis protein